MRDLDVFVLPKVKSYDVYLRERRMLDVFVRPKTHTVDVFLNQFTQVARMLAHTSMAMHVELAKLMIPINVTSDPLDMVMDTEPVQTKMTKYLAVQSKLAADLQGENPTLTRYSKDNNLVLGMKAEGSADPYIGIAGDADMQIGISHADPVGENFLSGAEAMKLSAHIDDSSISMAKQAVADTTMIVVVEGDATLEQFENGNYEAVIAFGISLAGVRTYKPRTFGDLEGAKFADLADMTFYEFTTIET